MFEPTFVQHRGERILRLEYAGLTPGELVGAFEQAATVIRAEPQASLRILTILSCRFNEECAEVFKRCGAANAPYVRASAVVASSFWTVVVTSLKLRERPDLEFFENEAAARDWLSRA